MDAWTQLQASLTALKARTDFAPRIGIVLGSGLGTFVESLSAVCIVPYAEIKGFPRASVAGHAGRFVFADLEGVPVVLMQGRVHYYEGYEMQDVVLPIRLMGLLGVRHLLLTNAAGGLYPDCRPGDFMLLTDHIASFVPSPLRGPNLDQAGSRFPDMRQIYDAQLQGLMQDAAKQADVALRQGVYLQVPGPQYETPAEIRMYRALGADAVGMSTACEAVAAHHMGMRVCGLSVITNLASGMSDQTLSHSEVQRAGALIAPKFEALLRAFCRKGRKKLFIT